MPYNDSSSFSQQQEVADWNMPAAATCRFFLCFSAPKLEAVPVVLNGTWLPWLIPLLTWHKDCHES